MKIEKEIERFLYPSLELNPNYQIQRVYGNEKKQAIAWIPGKLNSVLAIEKIKEASEWVKLTGYTGKVYARNALTMNTT